MVLTSVWCIRLSAQLVQEMGPLQTSDEAKRRYFGQRMAELVSNEFTLYRKVMESTNRRDDVNVLVSMPEGLLEMLDPVLELGVFRSNQEFYKASLFYLMDVYREMEIQIDTISSFTGTPRVRSSLDGEDENIRKELEGDGSRGSRPVAGSSRLCPRNRREYVVLCISLCRWMIKVHVGRSTRKKEIEVGMVVRFGKLLVET